jgi:hypothetical protein
MRCSHCNRVVDENLSVKVSSGASAAATLTLGMAGDYRRFCSEKCKAESLGNSSPKLSKEQTPVLGYNAKEIKENTTAVDRNTTAVDRNTTAVDRNTTAVDRNTTAVDRNTESVAENTYAVQENTSALRDVTEELKENRHELIQQTAILGSIDDTMRSAVNALNGLREDLYGATKNREILEAKSKLERADILVESDMPLEALKLIEDAIVLNPADFSVWYSKMSICVRSMRAPVGFIDTQTVRQDAANAAERALKLLPKGTQARSSYVTFALSIACVSLLLKEFPQLVQMSVATIENLISHLEPDVRISGATIRLAGIMSESGFKVEAARVVQASTAKIAQGLPGQIDSIIDDVVQLWRDAERVQPGVSVDLALAAASCLETYIARARGGANAFSGEIARSRSGILFWNAVFEPSIAEMDRSLSVVDGQSGKAIGSLSRYAPQFSPFQGTYPQLHQVLLGCRRIQDQYRMSEWRSRTVGLAESKIRNPLHIFIAFMIAFFSLFGFPPLGLVFCGCFWFLVVRPELARRKWLNDLETRLAQFASGVDHPNSLEPVSDSIESAKQSVFSVSGGQHQQQSSGPIVDPSRESFFLPLIGAIRSAASYCEPLLARFSEKQKRAFIVGTAATGLACLLSCCVAGMLGNKSPNRAGADSRRERSQNIPRSAPVAPPTPQAVMPQPRALEEINLLSIRDDVRARLLGELEAARQHQQTLLIELTTQDHACTACAAIDLAMKSQTVGNSLHGVRWVRVDLAEGVRALRISTSVAPVFLLVGAELQLRDGISGGEWDQDTPENIAPVLSSFVRGNLSVRRSPGWFASIVRPPDDAGAPPESTAASDGGASGNEPMGRGHRRRHRRSHH